MRSYRSRSFEIGPALDFDADLGRARVTYSYVDHGGIFGGDPPYPTVTNTQTIGTMHVGALLVIGGAFDL